MDTSIFIEITQPLLAEVDFIECELCLNMIPHKEAITAWIYGNPAYKESKVCVKCFEDLEGWCHVSDGHH